MTPVAKTADRVEQTVFLVDAANKRDMLVELFADAELSRAIVFTRTKPARRVAQTLHEAGIDAAPSMATRARASASALWPRFAAARRGNGRDRYRRTRHRHR